MEGGASSSPIQVRLQRRRQDPTLGSSSSSLFARLSPALATALYDEALERATSSGGQEKELLDSKGWNVVSSSALQEESGRIDFLPLAVTFDHQETIYVSYNGGEATYHGDDNAFGDLPHLLELPSTVIPSEVSETTTKVQVTALSSIRDADILRVEPLTCDDWELLEIKAEFLESGALLRQVSVVYSEQIIPLWVGAQDVANIRVLADNFEDANGHCCLRLVRDTRISVTPKPRPKLDLVSPPLRIYPTAEDYSQPMKELAKAANKPLVNTSPGTAFVNPASRNDILGFEDDGETGALAVVWNSAMGRDVPKSKDDDRLGPNSSCLLQIAFCKDIPENHIAIHSLTRARLNLVPFVDMAFVKLLSPIEVLRGSSMLGQHEEGQETPIITTPVEPKRVRTGKKWRYPNGLDLETTGTGSPVLDQKALPFSREPLEDGSFLLSSGRFHRVSFRSVGMDDTGGNENRATDDRCFVFRGELPLIAQNMTEQGRNSDRLENGPLQFSPNDSPLATECLEIFQTPQIMNLLPETSVLPSGLHGINAEWSNGDALVFGDNGSGKTHTAMVLAAFGRLEDNCSTFYLDCKRLKEAKNIRMKDILSEIHKVFREAISSSGNSTVILDDLDELTPNLDSDSEGGSAQSHQVNPVAVDQAKLIGDIVKRHIELKPFKKPTGEGNFSVTCIVTCRDASSLLQSIVNARPFTRRVSVPNLVPHEKEALFWRMTVAGTQWNDLCSDAVFKSRRVGRKCEGYRPQDLLLLASKVKHSLQSKNRDISVEHVAREIDSVLESFTPMRKLSLTDNSNGAADWSDIGGLFNVKEALTSTILNPAKYRRIYDKAKIRLPRGVLLFGGPGNGKSYVVPALAKKCGFSLITCRGPELLDRYIGASESKVRELFARAAASSPSILFFDEIDSLAPRRGSDRTGVTDRVVNQLLTLLDGVEDAAAAGTVYIIAATSRPDIIDPALLRPGRLEKHIYVGYPVGDDESTEVLLKIASRYSVDAELLDSISSGQLVREWKDSSPNFHRLSAADMKAAFDTAQLNAIHEVLQKDPSSDHVVIEHCHMSSALQSTKPSLPERDYATLMAAYKPFRKDLVADFSRQPSTPKPGLRTALR